MVLSWWANIDGKVIIGTLPDSVDMRHQVRREALAGVLALEASPCLPPCGREGFFRGRCLAVSPADQAERARIHAELQAVGLALLP